MNPFESGARKVIPAVLVYGRFEDQVLMIHRDRGIYQNTGDVSSTGNQATPGKVDYHEGKWNGLGGKCELDESPLDAAGREFYEESGLLISPEKFQSLGVLQFPNFKPHKNEDWIVFVFVVHLTSSDLSPALRSKSVEGVIISDEGTLHWVPLQKLLSVNLWPGDRHFIPYVIEEKPFIGTVWYDKLLVSRYWIQSLGLTIK